MYRDVYVVLIPLICLAVTHPTTAGTVTYLQDWEGPASLTDRGWQTGGQNGRTQSIRSSGGNPGQCLNMGGGTHAQDAWSWYDEWTIEYAGNEVVIDLDAYLVSSGWHYTDVCFGLYDYDNKPPYQPFVELNLNKAYPNTRNVHCRMNSENSEHTENVTYPHSYPSDQWFDATLRIRPDGIVEYYINNSLIHTTTKTIDPTIQTAKMYIRGWQGGGWAGADNISITVNSDADVPEPATMLAGLSGLVGIGRYLRRRK